MPKEIRAQSAMEYLMTYGWAILIIAVVLGALFELGVFSGTFFMPHVPPGSCHIFRPYGPGTVGSINLEGECQGALPQYVAEFNGRTSSVIAHSDLPNVPAGVTIAEWIYPSNTPSAEELPFTDEWGQQIAWNVNGIFSGTTNAANWISSAEYAPSTWYFVVITGTSGGDILYVNGKEVASGSGSPGSDSNSIYIGSTGEANGGGGCCNYAFQGYIANVQVYNNSLSANDVYALYSEGIGGAPIGLGNLVGWWPLNGNANDYSGNNNYGTASNVIYTTNWESGYTQP